MGQLDSVGLELIFICNETQLRLVRFFNPLKSGGEPLIVTPQILNTNARKRVLCRPPRDLTGFGLLKSNTSIDFLMRSSFFIPSIKWLSLERRDKNYRIATFIPQ